MIWASWAAAFGTVSAVVVALVQVRRERTARLHQEIKDREKADLDREERHRSHARLISAWTARAEEVPEDKRLLRETPKGQEWTYDFRTPVFMNNSSSEPAYEVVVGLVFIQGTAPHSLEEHLATRSQHEDSRKAAVEAGATHVSLHQPLPMTTLSILPPGTWRIWIQGKWHGGLGGRNGAEIAFTDRSSHYWIRRGNGDLEEIPTSPLRYFAQLGLHGPYDLRSPEPLPP